MAVLSSIWRLLFVLCAALALPSCAPAPAEGPIILAPASTQEAMEAVADAWAAKGHARPVLSIAGTPAIARQAAEGTPADLVITADTGWMDWLEARDLLRAGSRTDLLANALALVKSPSAASDAALTDKGVRIAMGDPDTVPAGRYARQVMEEAGQWDAIADAIVPTDNVRTALALVERGEADFAFVYASDLRHYGTGLAIVEIWSDIAGEAILYPVAQLRASHHPDAEELRRFLLSREATGIFARHTFLRPGGAF